MRVTNPADRLVSYYGTPAGKRLRLRVIRLIHGGMSQAEAARRCKVPPQTVNRWVLRAKAQFAW